MMGTMEGGRVCPSQADTIRALEPSGIWVRAARLLWFVHGSQKSGFLCMKFDFLKLATKVKFF